MIWTTVITLAIVLFSSWMDSLRDRHFGDRAWRRPIRVLWVETDLWHLVKWGSFYVPLATCCWWGYGAPWRWPVVALWAGTAALAWGVWRWGSPWPSFWAKFFRRERGR